MIVAIATVTAIVPQQEIRAGLIDEFVTHLRFRVVR
jgi:hypothetical protein